MILEVIEQNPRAIAFYRRHGFRELMRLVGWRRSADAAMGNGRALELVAASLEALRAPAASDYPEIPWPISRHASRECRKPARSPQATCGW
jgi:hypothetical protein